MNRNWIRNCQFSKTSFGKLTFKNLVYRAIELGKTHVRWQPEKNGGSECNQRKI